MAAQFEDLLSALCSGFELKHTTELQKHYFISEEKEAKLAFDVLVSYGFDAKVYPADDGQKGSKLYITLPATDTDPAITSQRLLAAVAYGKALHDIKLRLDNLCRDDAELLKSPSYTLTFANAPSGKQIVIGIQSAAAQSLSTSSSASQAPARPAVAAQPAQAARPVVKKAVKKKQEDDGFNQGPSIAKQLYAGPGGKKKDPNEPDDWRRQIFLYITGNIATGGAGVAAVVIVLFVLFSFWVLAKGFLCPDFAVEKKDVNRAWYCEKPPEQNDPNKPNQPELPQLPTGNIR